MAGDGKTYDGNRYAGHDMIYEGESGRKIIWLDILSVL